MKHARAIVLLIVAVAWYVFFGMIAPELYYSEPRTQAEVPADVATMAIELLKVIAPWVALVFVAYAAVMWAKVNRKSGPSRTG